MINELSLAKLSYFLDNRTLIFLPVVDSPVNCKLINNVSNANIQGNVIVHRMDTILDNWIQHLPQYNNQRDNNSRCISNDVVRYCSTLKHQ